MLLLIGLVSVAQADVEIFPLASSWCYEQTSNLDGTDWKSPVYDDSLWPQGLALLYVETNPLVKPCNSPLVLGRTTYYFRKRFVLPYEPTNVLLNFFTWVDDGAVFYLNGQEVKRLRMPSAPAAISYSNLATGSPSTGDSLYSDWFSVSGAAITNLAKGTNLLAVEVHQNSVDSDDIVFGASLAVKFYNCAPVLLRQPSDVTVLDSRQAMFSPLVDGNPTPAFQWFKNGSPVSSATNQTLSFASTKPTDAGTYWLAASNAYGFILTTNVQLTVVPDTNPPVVVSAVAEKTLTNISISFSEAIRASTAANLDAYEVYQTSEPSNRLVITWALPSQGSNVLLVTSPRTPAVHYSLRLKGIRDSSSSSNQVSTDVVNPLSYRVDLIKADAETFWRYFQAGVLPATDWTEPDFDDSSWLTGLAVFYAGNTVSNLAVPIRTTLSLTADTNLVSTYYFRTRFIAPGPIITNTFRLSAIADDGGVFYLNGSELGSTRMPTNRPVPYSQTASGSQTEHRYTTVGALWATNFSNWESCFAAEVHQHSSGFDDAAFAANFDAIISSYYPALQLHLPLVVEGAAEQVGQGRVLLNEPLATNLVVKISSPSDEVLPLPPVTIPAGEKAASFSIRTRDDTLVNGPREITITAEAPDVVPARGQLTILDDETNVVGVVFAPVFKETNAVICGEVRFARPAARDINITLNSSFPAELAVPANVLMPAGATSVVFQAIAVDDRLLDGARDVVLQASVAGWQTGQANVVIEDNEPNTIALQLPANLLEGSGVMTNAGLIQFGGIAVSNISVSISSSDPNRVLVPSELTLSAGKSNLAFTVQVLDNSQYDGDRPVTILAAASGFETQALTITVLENDAHHFAFGPISSPQYTNSPALVTVTAMHSGGQRQSNFSGYAGLTAAGASGPVTLAPATVGPFTNGVWTGSVQCLTIDRFVRLQTAERPGLSEAFHVEGAPYRTVGVTATELAWDPTRQRIFASVASDGGVYSNSVTAINPWSGTVDFSIPVKEITGWAGKIAISDDGQFLYLSVSNGFAIQRIDLATRSQGPAFPVGSGVFGAYLAADLVVLPGSPTAVAVARADYYNAHGVVIYDNGTPRPKTTPEISFSGINVIQPSGTSSLLFGYNNHTTGFDFTRIAVNASGATVLDQTEGWLSGSGASMKFDGGLIYGQWGAVIDPFLPSLVGRFDLSLSANVFGVEADTARERAYFLSIVDNKSRLQAHHLGTFLPLKWVELPSDDSYWNLLKWGTNGFAMFSGSGKIYLVQCSNLTPSGTPANLEVTQRQPACPVAGSDFTISVTVSNRGPETASEVVLTENWPTNSVLVSADLPSGIWRTNATSGNWRIGMLEPGSSATIEFTLRTVSAGYYTNRAFAVANESDTDLSDNVSTQEFLVGIDAQPDSVNQVLLPTCDLAYDPASGTIWASVPSRAGVRGNKLLNLQPSNALPIKSVYVGDEPERFVVSEDAAYLFICINTNTSVVRMKLASESLVGRVDLGTNNSGYRYTVQDLAALPGSPESFAVLRNLEGARDVTVYDGELLRPRAGNVPADRIEFGADAATLFANDNNHGLFRVQVDAEGVALLDSDLEILGAERSILAFSEGALYSTDGSIIDPTAMTIKGKLFGITNAAAVFYDKPARRLLFLQQVGSNCVLSAYEPGSFLLLGSMNIPGVVGTPSSLIRWGSDGVAFRTSGDQLFIVRTSLLPASSPADLAVELVSAEGSSIVGSNYTFTLQVVNRGPSLAEHVLITSKIPADISNVDVHLSQGSWTRTPGAVVCDLGQLASNDIAHIVVDLQIAAPGLVSFVTTASGSFLDTTNANNQVCWLVWASPATGSLARISANLGVNDIAVDRLKGRVYASVSYSAETFANTILSLDAAAGVAGKPLWTAGNPNCLALSADGGLLYAGLDHSSEIQCFDLMTWSSRLRFALDNRSSAAAMAVCPTNSANLVVRRSSDGRMVVYESGVKLPDELSNMVFFAFSSTNGDLYALDGRYEKVALYRVDWAGSGLELAESQSRYQYSTAFKGDGGLLFYDRGMVLDPLAQRVCAMMPVPYYNSLVEPDVASGRVFYLTRLAGKWSLHAFDLVQAIEVGSSELSGLVGTPKRLLRCGTDGFAICTDAGQLIILRSSLVPTNPPTDLALSQTQFSPTTTIGNSISLAVGVTNNGPATAHGIVVTQSFSLSVTQLVATPTAGLATVISNQIVWDVGTLHAGGVALLSTIGRPAQKGTLSAKTTISHAENDPSMANNVALSVVNVIGPSNANSLELTLMTRELIYDSWRNRIYASIASSEPFLGNSIVTIDPETGVPDALVRVGSEPSQLAMSSDGRWLYVGVDGMMRVAKIDLQNASAPITYFDLGFDRMFIAWDLKVQPGCPGTVAVARKRYAGFEWTDSAYPHDVVIYDAGRARMNAGRSTSMVEFSRDGAVLYGSIPPNYGYGLLRMPLDDSGILGYEVFKFSPSFNDLKLSNGRLYSDSGSVLEPSIPIVMGSVSSSGPVEVDPATGTVFYLSKSNTNWVLNAYNIASLQLTGTQAVAGVRGDPGSLIRCGGKRLAFRTSSNQVFVVSSSLVPESSVPSADLVVSQHAEQDFSAAKETVRFSITVTNRGPGLATNFTLAIRTPKPVESQVLTFAQGNATNSGEGYLYTSQPLLPGASLQLALTVTITNTIPLSNYVSVSSAAPDPEPDNNTSLMVINGLFFQREDTVGTIPVRSTALSYDSVRKRIMVGLTNRVNWYDPETGGLLGTTNIDLTPVRMLVTDDCQYMYLCAGDSNVVQRVYLPSMAVDLSLRVPGDRISAMTTLPGRPRAIALTYRSTNQVTTAVFDDDVLRPAKVEGLECTILACSADGNSLFGYANTDTSGASRAVFSMFLDGTGLVPSGNGPTNAPGYPICEMVFADGKLIFPPGNVLNPLTWTEETPFPVGPFGGSVAALPASDRIAFMTPRSDISGDVQVSIFGLSTRARLADVSIGYMQQERSGLIFCGADRWALRNRENIYVIRSSSMPAADLTLRASVSTNQVVVGDSVPVQLVVSNSGPSLVTDIVLSNMLPSGFALLSTECPLGSISVDGREVLARISSLPANAAAVVTMSVSPAGLTPGWFTNFASVTATGIPDPIEFNNHIKLPLLVTLRDSDHDGIPDDWEIAHGLNHTNSLDASLDSDCDGFSNLQEYQAGTDPMLFEDVRLTSTKFEAGAFQFDAHGALGKLYMLESSTDLTNWSSVATFRCTEPNYGIKVTGISGGYSFFRLRTDTAPAVPLIRLVNVPSPSAGPPAISVVAPPGRRYSLQTSGDLIQWSELTNFFGTSCETLITDPDGGGIKTRYYRVVVPSP